MNIQMTGIDHTTAPVEVRERFSLTTAAQARLMDRLAARAGISGVVLLCTCNRTEIWVHSKAVLSDTLERTLCEAVGAELESRLFISRQGIDAVAYLFHMTSGMQSRIFGEDQILTQVKEALDRARAAQCCDSVLEVLFRRAVTAAKKAKGVMQTSLTNANAVDCAIRQLTGEGWDFANKRCLVIGNGKMGKLAAQALREAGADVTVTVRQYRSGMVEIPAGCKRIDYGQRKELFPVCDLILSATTSPNITVRREALEQYGWKPGAVLIDLAVPRDIEPETAALPGLRLFDIDSFQIPESESLEAVRREAGALLDEELREFATWYDCRDLLPLAGRLSEHFARDLLARLGGLDSEIAQQIEDAAAKQARRLLFAIRDEAGAAVFRDCLEAVDKFYGRKEHGNKFGALV